MKDAIDIINTLLVNSFNQILTLEKLALKEGPFNELTLVELHAIEAITLLGSTMSETSKRLRITMGSLTVTVNRLVKKEYVLRTEKEGDRRIVNLTLTKKGKLAWRLHDRFHKHMVKTMLTELEEDEYRVLIRALENLVRFVEDKQQSLNGKYIKEKKL